MLLIRKCAMWIITILILFIGISYFLPISLSGIPVLNYHQVNAESHTQLTLSPYEFDAQMAYLHKSGYTTITPAQLVDYLQDSKPLPANPILITFDDGYEDNYREAYPILKKYNFTATFFIITDFVGKNSNYMTWNQIKEMHNNGFSFESHTSSHILLPSASDDEIHAQLIKSREKLEQLLNQKIEYLAYPGGAYDQRVIALTKEAGYRAAFTVDFGRDKTTYGLFALNRIPIFATSHSFLHFWLRLKFTQFFSTLQGFKTNINKSGAGKIANWIYIP
ncbi:MAG: polysaccharide deacetylase family protein [Veillonellales bacterium]